MQKNEIVDEWLNYANMDMISAQYLTSLKPMPYEIICYHCQQTVEKLLKAIIIYNIVNTKPPIEKYNDGIVKSEKV